MGRARVVDEHEEELCELLAVRLAHHGYEGLIATLTELFLRRACAKHALGRIRLSPDALRANDWPGSVQELANVVEAAALLATEGVVELAHLEAAIPRPSARTSFEPRLDTDELPPMAEARQRFDRAYLCEVLRRTRGNVSAAARLAGRNRTDFHDLLKRHGVDASEFRE